MEIVSQAQVPIGTHEFDLKLASSHLFSVKFVDSQTGIRCDLNINDRLGLRNTHLLAKYCEIMPQLPVLAFLVKQWAKANNLNTPSSRRKGVPASFSSYALTLMTIGHLQVRLLENTF